MSSNQSSAAVVSRPGTPRASEEYIASLAGRYNTLQDSRTISGTAASWKFNRYAYTCKLLLRKTLENDSDHHVIYCTYCTSRKGFWKIDAQSTTTSLQLRHLRQQYSSLPTSQEEELRYLDRLQTRQTAASSKTTGRSCSFYYYSWKMLLLLPVVY